MPSFLNKVFGRKKDGDKLASSPTSHTSQGSGKRQSYASQHDSTSPATSPSAANFDRESTATGGGGGGPLSLFRSKSRNVLEEQHLATSTTPPPMLTLNLPTAREEKSHGALGAVFDTPDSSVLSDEAIGERELTPREALLLVKACSEAIVSHGGLETLGLMHPHWYAASPDAQRKLIALYIRSLGSRSGSPNLAPVPTTPAALFATELEYTRSPHDIAAVMRWAIRHLRLDGPSFGIASSGADEEWGWYRAFAAREREAEFPPAAFSQSLAPLLPADHLQLLTATLDIISSLAAHAETTGASGSKLAMLFGLWLLVKQRAREGEDWTDFYGRWERAGRVLEHLFLAHVREESLSGKMPLRLSELVKHYPYAGQQTNSPSADDLSLLPRPRFSTRQFDALYIRIDTQLSSDAKLAGTSERDHPLHIIHEAVQAVVKPDASLTEEAKVIWEDIKRRASSASPEESLEDNEQNKVEKDDVFPSLTKVLDDETIRILSLMPAGPATVSSPATPASSNDSGLSPASTSAARPPMTHRRSTSADPAIGKSTNGAAGSHVRDATAPASMNTTWSDFSVTGFGESLLGGDFSVKLEPAVTAQAASQKTPAISMPKKRRNTSPGRSRAALTRAQQQQANYLAPATVQEEQPQQPATLAAASIIQLDEAFVDFWADSLSSLSGTSSGPGWREKEKWPSFVVCQLKPGVWRVGLLVIEHSYSRPPPPPPPAPTETAQANGSINGAAGEKRSASPRPSMTSANNVPGGRKNMSFTFSPTKKRFSFFSTSSGNATQGVKSKGKSGKSPRIGELGEILSEEPQPLPQVQERNEQLPPVPREADLPPVPNVLANEDKALPQEPEPSTPHSQEQSGGPSAQRAPVAVDAHPDTDTEALREQTAQPGVPAPAPADANSQAGQEHHAIDAGAVTDSEREHLNAIADPVPSPNDSEATVVGSEPGAENHPAPALATAVDAIAPSPEPATAPTTATVTEDTTAAPAPVEPDAQDPVDAPVSQLDRATNATSGTDAPEEGVSSQIATNAIGRDGEDRHPERRSSTEHAEAEEGVATEAKIEEPQSQTGAGENDAREDAPLEHPTATDAVVDRAPQSNHEHEPEAHPEASTSPLPSTDLTEQPEPHTSPSPSTDA